jgi:hypothetical protein
MARIKKDRNDFRVRLTCMPFATGKFSLMEIFADVTKPKANSERCDVSVGFSGTPGSNMMRPSEVVVFVEALRGTTAEARKTAEEFVRKGSPKAKKRAGKA